MMSRGWSAAVVLLACVTLAATSYAGELDVMDSIAPLDDLAMPFGVLQTGVSRVEHVTVANLDAINPLVVTEIRLGRQGVVEDFEDGDLAEYLEPGGGAPTHVVGAAAAHDGSYGLQCGEGNDWCYRDDTDVHVGQGNTVSYWAKFVSSGRIYCGFGATSAGTYSMVMAPNSNELLLQRNDGYGYLDIGTSSQSWEMDKWYRLEVQWDQGGAIAGRLYDSDGTTLLNAVTATDTTYTNGGLAFRAFALGYVDTVTRSGSTPYGFVGDTAAPEPRDPDQAAGWDVNNHSPVYETPDLPPSTGVGPATPAFQLANLPTLPVTVTPGSSFTFDVVFSPPSVGPHATAIVIASDDLDENEVQVIVDGTGVAGYLNVTPEEGFAASGPAGGPFTPGATEYTVTNLGSEALQWTAGATAAWLDLEPGGGMLPAGMSAQVTAALNTYANGLPEGTYTDVIEFTDVTAGRTVERNATLSIFAPPPQAIYWFPMDANPGWTADGGWEFGVPTGGGSSCHDPSAGHTGVTVYGYNLNGDYPNSMPQEYLTAGPLNCGGYEHLRLDFWRWLGVESATYDHAKVEYSIDGTTWVVLWEHTGASFCDGTWIEYNYPMPQADNQPTVYLRWTMGSTDGSVTYPGWNLDDVAILGDSMDDLRIEPNEPFTTSGHLGGPFDPSDKTYTLTNVGPAALSWTATKSEEWFTVAPMGGTLEAGASTTVHMALNAAANGLAQGQYADAVIFTNETSGVVQTRNVALEVYTAPEIGVTPSVFDVVVPAGGQETRTLTISNSGDADLHFAIRDGEIGRSPLDNGKSLTLESVVDENTLVLEYAFSEPVWSRSGDYERIAIPGLAAYERTGAPIVPVRPAVVLIPFGKRIADVQVTVEGVRDLDGVHRLAPGQKPHPLSYTGAVEATPPDEDVYGKDAPWPGKDFEELPQQSKRGYALFFVNLFPVQYRPASGAVSCAAKIRVVFKFVEAGAPGALRPSPAARVQILNSVDNHSALASYPTDAATEALDNVALPPGGPFEYVIVTDAALAAAPAPYNFQALRDARIAEGRSATIVTTDYIYAHYSGVRPDGGTDNQTKIRNFLMDAYTGWSTQYVLLGGTSGTVPPRLFWVDSFAGEIDQMPVDMYYGCVEPATCTFDNDVDGLYGEPTDGPGGGDVDMAAEIFVGRAPVENAAELASFVQKTLAYNSTSDAYLNQVTMGGEYLGFGGVSDYATDSMEQIRLGSSADGYTTVGFENHTQPDFYAFDTSVNLYDSPTYEWTAGELMARFNGGVHIFNHLGHSNQTYCAKLTTGNLPALTNTKGFFMYSQGCMPGWFDSPDCFAEVLTTIPHGAFAAIMNARYGWGTGNSTDGPSNRFNRRYWDAVLDQRKLEIARANQDSKEDNLYDINGSCIRWCYYELNVFGDPAQRLRVQEDCEWLTETPDNGTVPPGGSSSVNVAFLAESLPPGVYTGEIRVQSDARALPLVTVPVTMTVVSETTVAANRSFWHYKYASPGVEDVTVAIVNTGADNITELRFSETVPEGWTFNSVVSPNPPAGQPAAGATGTLEFSWSVAPEFPVALTYRLNVPAGQSGGKAFSGHAIYRRGGPELQAPVGPLTNVMQRVHHASDYNPPNHTIALGELLRLIQFYNSTEYHVDASGADGYKPGPGSHDGAPHDSDYKPQNWKIGLPELLRLIQFYNSGGYHVQESTEDGFAPGP